MLDSINKKSENTTFKYEQQKQKCDAEYSSRCMAEQRALFLEQAVGAVEQKLNDTSRRLSHEIENVIKQDIHFFWNLKIETYK